MSLPQVAVARLDWRRLLQLWQRASPFFADVAAATGADTTTSAAASTAVSAAVDPQQVMQGCKLSMTMVCALS
jgi:hypothetical protein